MEKNNFKFFSVIWNIYQANSLSFLLPKNSIVSWLFSFWANFLSTFFIRNENPNEIIRRMIPIESIVVLSVLKFFASSARLLPFALSMNKNPMLLTMKIIVIDVQMLPLEKLAKAKPHQRQLHSTSDLYLNEWFRTLQLK